MSVSARGKPSRVRVLETVKKLDSPTLSQLSNELKMSKTAILKQVSLLERDGVISRTYVQTGKGRPVCKVNVTNNAYDQLQDIYRSIAEDALSYVEKKFGCSMIKEIMALRNEKLIEEYRMELTGRDWESILKKFEEMRNREGYLAEVTERQDGSIEISEFNCPLIKIAEKYREACSFERDFLSYIFGMEIIQMSNVLENSRSCKFILREKL